MTYVAAHVPQASGREQARAHFRAIFGADRGWIEVSAIEGDPDDRRHCRFIQGWFDYAPDRLESLLDKIHTLMGRYGNAYTSITLYAEPIRDKAHALPGRTIPVDDAPPASYTYTLQTSHDREQGFIILDQLADVATREQIARRLAHAGADKSGWDITQLMRVPGTFNTKVRTGGHYGRGPRDWVKGTGHRVTLIPRTLRTYTLAELDQRAPKVERDDSGPIADLDWPEVEQWLGNLAPLMDDRGFPRRWKSHTQSYRVLSGDVVPVNDKGEADESTRRAFLARGCAWARYPHDAAAAILWKHTGGAYIARKGTAWHKDDIARVIAKEYAIVASQVADYQIRPITAAEQKHGQLMLPELIAEVERISRARHDRPQLFTPATLYAKYKAEPALCDQSRTRRAADLGISTATLDRHEGELRKLGLIDIASAGRGHAGRVVLVGVIIIPPEAPPPEVLSGLIAKAPIAAAESAQNADRDPQYIGGTHPPPAVNPSGGTLADDDDSPYIRLIDAVHECFTVYHDRELVLPKRKPAQSLTELDPHSDTYKRRKVKGKKGGARRKALRKPQIVAYLASNYPELADHPLLDKAIADERQYQKLAPLADMPTNTLKAEIRRAEHEIERGHSQRWWNVYRNEARRILASRPADPERRSSPCEAVPDLRSTAAAIQRGMEDEWLDLVETTRPRPIGRAAWLAEQSPRGVCSPQPTPGTPASLLASIRDYHQRDARAHAAG